MGYKNLRYRKKIRKIGRKICITVLGGIILCGLLINREEVCAFAERGKYATVEGNAEVKELRESELYAQAAVLMDAQTGRVLFGKNTDEVLPMASTTKIMTLLVALEKTEPNDVVTVSAYAARMPDVQLNIREGEQYYIKDLLYSLMLESHNDVAVAIAEGVAGSVENFAGLMNQKAKEIGCENTTFITPNGLDATATMNASDGEKREVTHSTTAEDLAKIMSYCIKHSPYKEQFLEITRTPEYTFSDCNKNRQFTCRNHNSFLYMMEGALSGKTGFTGKAGYCYVGALERDGRTFVVSLLACGWPNNKTYKWKDTKKLMEYGIENYTYSLFADASKEISKTGTIAVLNGRTNKIGDTARVKWKAETAPNSGENNSNENSSNENSSHENNSHENNSPVGKADVKPKLGKEEGVLLRKDEKIDVEYEIAEQLKAPVKEGETIGSIRYLINGELYKEEKLILESSVEAIDYVWCLGKIWDEFFLF